jgi:hypothetical protein
MADIASKPYPTEPIDPVDPTGCPTCRSGFQPVDPIYEEVISAEYTTKG